MFTATQTKCPTFLHKQQFCCSYQDKDYQWKPLRNNKRLAAWRGAWSSEPALKNQSDIPVILCPHQSEKNQTTTLWKILRTQYTIELHTTCNKCIWMKPRQNLSYLIKLLIFNINMHIYMPRLFSQTEFLFLF